MSYVRLILKKIYKNKFNIIPLLLIYAFTIFIYGSYNIKAVAQMSNPEDNGELEIASIDELTQKFESIIDDPITYSSTQIEMAERDLDMAEKRRSLLQNRLDSYENKDWENFYKAMITLDNITLKVTKESELPNKEFEEVLNKNLEFYQFMIDYDLGYDDRFSGVQGFSFLCLFFNEYLAFILCFVLIYYLSRVYCSSHIDHIDLQKLLPLSNMKKQISMQISGMVVGFALILMIACLCIVCGTIGQTLGSLNTPISLYTMTGLGEFVPFITLLPQFLLLLVLTILFITNVTMVISKLIYKKMPCLLISMVFILGSLFVIPNIAPLTDVMHLFPTTYIESLKTITGEYAYSMNNGNINFINGMIVLLTSNIILMLCYYYMPKILAKVVKNK